MSDPAASSSYVRGSSLLLAGRLLSLAINFAGQVIIVRYLTKSSYGSYAFALSLATMISNAASLGFQTTIARFAPIYREEEDYPRLFGSLLFMGGAILGIGIAIIVLLLGSRTLIVSKLVDDPASAAVLFIFIYFIPVNALDRYLESAMAVFAGPRAIFLRRHVVGPCLKLLAILLVVVAAGDERLLAWGQVTAGVLGVLLYVVILLHALRAKGLLDRFDVSNLTVPTSPLFRFGLPIMVSDLNFVARGAVVLLLLESLHGNESVADYRAVMPLADLNKLVSRNFTILFIPVVARLIARGEGERVADVVRQSMMWIALLTLPLFLCCFVLSEPITVLLFGGAYASSAPILAALSLAYYAHSILSISAQSLRVFARLRLMLVIEIGASFVTAGFALVWIPKFGALGAGCAVAAGTIVQGVLAYGGMRWATGIQLPMHHNLRLAASVLAATFGLWSLQRAFELPLWCSVPAACGLSAAVMAINRRPLTIGSTFPELGRLPFVGRLTR